MVAGVVLKSLSYSSEDGARFSTNDSLDGVIATYQTRYCQMIFIMYLLQAHDGNKLQKDLFDSHLLVRNRTLYVSNSFYSRATTLIWKKNRQAALLSRPKSCIWSTGRGILFWQSNRSILYDFFFNQGAVQSLPLVGISTKPSAPVSKPSVFAPCAEFSPRSPTYFITVSI